MVLKAPLLIKNCLSAATPCAALSPASLQSCARPKRSAVRRSLQAMAVAFGKMSNDADGRFVRALRGGSELIEVPLSHKQNKYDLVILYKRMQRLFYWPAACAYLESGLAFF